MRILMTGATGLIGKELGLALVRRGHELVVVSRDPGKVKLLCPFPAVALTWEQLARASGTPATCGPIDAIINLAGEGVATGAWTKEKKRAILNSRIESLKEIAVFAKNQPSVKAIVSASAIGYYGDRKNESLNEHSAPGKGFLSHVCQKWEQALFSAELPPSIRRVAIRIGVVLDPAGGALTQMLPIFKLGLGGPIGLSKTWLSWIHISDLVRLFVWAIEQETVRGVYNGVSGTPVTNFEFAKALAEALGTKSKVPAPEFILKLALGEMAEVAVQSQKIDGVRCCEAGFQFEFSNLNDALHDLLPNGAQHETRIVQKQWLNATPEKIFPFFCDENNLEKLTPAFLKFKIESTSGAQIQLGTEIKYRLKVHGVPIRWLTEINQWDPPYGFVDVQRKGPYRLWHHTHSFEPLAGGTLMKDVVRYKLPWGWLGRVGDGTIVNHDVRAIFEYRRKQVAKLFGMPV